MFLRPGHVIIMNLDFIKRENLALRIENMIYVNNGNDNEKILKKFNYGEFEKVY